MRTITDHPKEFAVTIGILLIHRAWEAHMEQHRRRFEEEENMREYE